MLLSEIATISSGYLFRNKLVHRDDGKYGVIQMKDIDSFNRLDMTGVEKVNIKSIKKEYLLKKNDILFRSRGQQNLATLIGMFQRLDSDVCDSPQRMAKSTMRHQKE